MANFDLYYMIKCVCVLEKFNCMLFEGWTLSGTRTVIQKNVYQNWGDTYQFSLLAVWFLNATVPLSDSIIMPLGSASKFQLSAADQLYISFLSSSSAHHLKI